MRTAFTLPAGTFHRLLARFACAIVVVALAAVWLLHTSTRSITADALLTLSAVGVLYVLGRGFAWIEINRAGIIGPLRAFGPRIKIEWSAPVVVRSTPYLGLSGASIITVAGAGSVFVPSAILHSSEFTAAIKQFAPPEYPLMRSARSAA